MRLLRLTAVLLLIPASTAAEKLPATWYDIEQGLANNNVYRIVADSRGFVWFATREGLSRFDGYTFTNYGEADGLPSAVIHDLLETRDGVYLLATAGGLARLENNGRHRSASALFSSHRISDDPRARYITTLFEDRRGTVWVGTRVALFAIEQARGDLKVRRVMPAEHGAPLYVWSIREDRFGTVWIGSATGLRRIWPDGRVDTHFPELGVHSVLPDRAGQLWVGTRLSGLLRLTFHERTGQLVGSRRFTRADGYPTDWVNQLAEDREGTVWAAAPGGLIQITETEADTPRMRRLSEPEGVGRFGFNSVALDRSGNLWGGTEHGGAVKVARSGFSNFGPPEGSPWAVSLLQAHSGDLCFLGPVRTRHGWGLHCFNGQSFDVVQPNLLPGAGTLTWGWNQLALQDRTGEWWFATREGVARFARATRPHDLQGRSPVAWYRARDGLANNVIMRLFEDSRGDIWISAVGEGARNGLSRWKRSTKVLEHFTNQANLPDLDVYFPTAFEEDRAGNVWIGFSGDGGVARFSDNRFSPLNAAGLFRAAVRNIFRDSQGRLWVCSLRGLVRVEDPGAAAPAFVAYTTANGLSSNEATAIVEDLEGRLYIGTARGIDRLDPETGRFKRYSTRDGLKVGEISGAMRERSGHLWFAQPSGASRLIPPPDPTPTPPPILITGLEVDGELRYVEPLGQTALPALELGARRNQLRVDYLALGLGAGEDLRYQYRLEGGLGEWSAPSLQRSVTFANVAPGSYRFEVRAISSDGIISDQPATLQFTIAPPLWQRWWFIALAAAGGAAALYAVYRIRLQRAVEIATVRTRIATDLHDDIGANLTKIAILSEVARQQLGGTGEAGERLSAIARISRESVASMSDVVWAINPKRDTLRDTIRRMRQHAEEVFAGSGVTVHFQAPERDERVRLPIHIRRDVFLIFKEALNNAVRHSRCRMVTIDVRVQSGGLDLRITDDGNGFDGADRHGGNGLASMRRRAVGMNASLEIVSAPGRGTSVVLCVPGSFVDWLRHPA